MTAEQLTQKVQQLEARRERLREEEKAAEKLAEAARGEAMENDDLPVPAGVQANVYTLREMLSDADAELERLRAELAEAETAERVNAERAELVRLAEDGKAAERDYLRAMREGNRAAVKWTLVAVDARRRAREARKEFIKLAARHAPIMASGAEVEVAQREFLARLRVDTSAVRRRYWNGAQSRPTGIDVAAALELPEPFGRMLAEAMTWPALHKLPENG